MLSIEKTMELHKELWTRIADLIKSGDESRRNTACLKEKALYPILKREKLDTPVADCFLCQYKIDYYNQNGRKVGGICLCTKHGNCDPINCLDGLYYRFIDAVELGNCFSRWDPAIKLAKKIADLPLHEKYR